MAAKTIIVDSRQQEGKHELKHAGLRAAGYALVRSKLPHGDYAFPPKCSIDTKQSIGELYSDMTTQHERFRNECIGAMEAGTQLVILTENEHGITNLADLAEWKEQNPDFKKRKHAQKPIDGKRLASACSTMSKRYGVMFGFCKPEETAGRIIEILERMGNDGND